MKELSIEQKAKAYDEKLDVASHIYADPSVKDEDKYYIEVIFPEIEESDDERIRKELIFYFQEEIPQCSIQEHADKMKEFIAWLEKQGGPTDEIKPKFEVGDKIKYSSNVYEVLAVKEHYYELSNGNVLEFKNQDKWQLVEQKPAWSEEDELHIKELESLVKQVWAIGEHENDKDTIHKMSDLSFFLKTLKPQLKQEWSEEDEEQLGRALYMMEQLDMTKSWDDVYNWLKSLRPYSQWKPSDEQMKALKRCCDGWSDNGDGILDSLYEQLKKLK